MGSGVGVAADVLGRGRGSVTGRSMLLLDFMDCDVDNEPLAYAPEPVVEAELLVDVVPPAEKPLEYEWPEEQSEQREMLDRPLTDEEWEEFTGRKPVDIHALDVEFLADLVTAIVNEASIAIHENPLCLRSLYWLMDDIERPMRKSSSSPTRAEPTYRFSFVECCNYLSVDPDVVRYGILKDLGMATARRLVANVR